jgi:hypothetical protein
MTVPLSERALARSGARSNTGVLYERIEVLVTEKHYQSFSRQLVAIDVSIVFRTVMPSDRKVLKCLASWIAIFPPTRSMIDSDVSSLLP